MSAFSGGTSDKPIDLAKIKWRDVPGTGGLYAVSSDGRVRGPSGRILRAVRRTADAPYLCVTVCAAGKRVTRCVHQLVAEAFMGPRPDGHDAAHLNGGGADNAAVNLAYITHGENQRQKALHGTLARGERHGMAKFTDAVALEIRRGSESIHDLAAQHGVSVETVRSIRNGTGWKHLEAYQ